nr:MAG TPA: cysteine-rich protein [Caudoviricetes sp.]
MRTTTEHGRLLTVKDGYVVCPVCKRNKKLLPILPDTSGRRIVAYCRLCKARTIVDIEDGLCFESLCR